MKTFGGPALFLDRDDINTDEIIPAKYLTEISKIALKPHLLEDLLIDGRPFAHNSYAMEQAEVIVSRRNFGCGSSREHAVWAFEVHDINLIIAESFARIFRQNMFNCGILAVELPGRDIEALFAMRGEVAITVDLDGEVLTARSSEEDGQVKCGFSLNPFDRELIAAGGWLAYADQKY